LETSKAVEDFHSVAADLEAICAGRGIWIELVRGEEPFGHAGKTARVIADGKDAGYILSLKPEIEAEQDIPGPVYLFEIDMDILIRGGLAEFGEARRYPPVYRDISLLVKEGEYSEEVLELLRSLADPLLEKAWLFDVYSGKGIPDGYRSLAFSLAYRDPDRTLRDDEVDLIHERLRTLLKEKGIVLR